MVIFQFVHVYETGRAAGGHALLCVWRPRTGPAPGPMGSCIHMQPMVLDGACMVYLRTKLGHLWGKCW